MTLRDKLLAAQHTMYTGVMDIIGFNYETDEHGIRQPVEVTQMTQIPCRLSYQANVSTNQDGAADTVQEVKVYCDPDIQIPSGSALLVTQNDRTERYEISAPPVVYLSHQEIGVELYQERA